MQFFIVTLCHTFLHLTFSLIFLNNEQSNKRLFEISQVPQPIALGPRSPIVLFPNTPINFRTALILILWSRQRGKAHKAGQPPPRTTCPALWSGPVSCIGAMH